MDKIKALRYIEPGKIDFIEMEKCKPSQNQLGIDILSSSLCNTSELRSYKGGYKTGYGVSYPMKNGEPGHEAVGVVSAIGLGVKGYEINDYVAMTGHGGEPCHRSYVNRNYTDVAKVISSDRDVNEAAILEMYGCAYHCVMTNVKAADYKGKSVLVIGMGSMGLCTVQILKNLDTAGITAVDVSEDRLETAKESGADIIAVPGEIRESDRFDIIIECSGSGSGQELACTLAPKILIFSSYSTKGITIHQNLWFDANTTIYNPGILTSDNFIKTASLYNNGLINPSLLISKRIRSDADEYLETIKEIIEGKIIKTLMKWR